jgi:membrane-bound metal-dependent hydrolase YbcI (DUF457 family)
MSDANVHMLAGVAAGFAAIPVCERILPDESSPFERLTTFFSAIMGSRAPDVFEPADSPDHRGFFHSLAACCLLGVASLAAVRELRQFEQQAGETINRYVESGLAIPAGDWWMLILSRLLICALVGFLFGYESHLVLDGMTPKSLPLLGN